MNKKMIVLIGIVVTLMLILVIINNKNNRKNTDVVPINIYTTKQENESYVLYNEDGEEIIRADDEGSLEIYKRDPSYNPQPPIKESGIDLSLSTNEEMSK